MKTRSIIFLSALSFCFSDSVFAQAFLNGSFETNTAAACDYNMTNASFTTKMANTTAYGLGGELDIMQTTCPYGPSQNGTWFAALACPSGNTDAFTMRLSAPLTAGVTYTMSFWDKGDIGCCPPGMPVIIGVSTVAGASGTTVYTGPVPTTGVWNQRCFSFVAPVSGQHISVRTAGATRWSHVDNFVMNSPCTVLPIELIFFKAECLNNSVVLNWATATEKNNDYFTIESSLNGIDFEELEKIKGAGNSYKQLNYTFTDSRSQNDITTYYRIRQTDFDGSSSFSHIVTAQGCKDAGNFVIELFPNPAANDLFVKSDTDDLICEIYNVLGEKVSESKLNSGKNKIDIDRLPNGTYIVKISGVNTNSKVQKLVINR